MSLIERGRTGVKVELAADGVTGVVTQDPESMLHSMGGLTNASGNTAFGVPFQLSAYSSQATSGTTTVNFAASNLPYKVRVLSAEVRCLNDGNRASSGGQNGCTVLLSQGATTSMGSADCGGMVTDEVRTVKMGWSGNEVIDEDGSLRVSIISRLGLHDKAFTFKLLVTLNCVRVL